MGFAVLFVIIHAVTTDRTYRETHANLIDNVEGLFEDLPFAPYMRQGHYEYLRLTGRHHFNGVTFLTDGRFMLDNLEPHFFLYERADGIIALGNYLNRRDIPFLYVRLPNKLEDNSVLPIAFSDNQSIEYGYRLAGLISDAGINTLDLRTEMMNEGMDFATAFFRMDHHWTAETALWASETMITHLNNTHGFGVNTDVWNIDNFGRVTFENAFNGEEAVAVHAYHLFEDITAIYPHYQTDLALATLYGRIVSYGDFVDTFVPRLRDEYVEHFGFADMVVPIYPFVSITNSLADNNKRVLIIADSNGLLQTPLLSLGFANTDLIYLINEVTPNWLWYVLDLYDYDFVIMAVSDVVVAHESVEHFFQDRLFLGYPPY